MRSKKRSKSHLVDEQAQALFEALLPANWVIRGFHPDYGIDYIVELFDPKSHEALGEFVLVQLKGHQSVETQSKRVIPRINVEKPDSKESRRSTGSDDSIDIPVVRQSLETTEIRTVERMGAALPVLLCIADLSDSSLYFVCLNDYIEKILNTGDEKWRKQKSASIYIPARLKIANQGHMSHIWSWYGKRTKLYAAFQKFAYQKVELEYVSDAELLSHARHFADKDLSLDIWAARELWAPIEDLRLHLTQLSETTSENLVDSDFELSGLSRTDINLDQLESDLSEDMIEAVATGLKSQSIRFVWHQAALLGRMYEEICKEWFLPTHLSEHLSN